MLDVNLLRKDLDFVIQQLERRRKPQNFLDVDRYHILEGQRKALQVRAQTLQSERNQLSMQIGQAKSKGVDTTLLQEKVSEGKTTLAHIETNLERIQAELNGMLMHLPNLPDVSVPDGVDAEDNQEVRREGSPRVFDFPIQDHVAVGEKLGLDFGMASKLAGARFSVLHGQLAHLHRALAQWMLDVHTQEHGYEEAYVPYLVNSETITGTGQLPKFKEDLFMVPRGEFGEFFLIPTAEVPLTNFVAQEIIAANTLPLKFVAHTPCFRSEAGSYGKDVRGMIRQHQFDKVELVWVSSAEASMQALEQLTAHAETILKKLELPFRTIVLCSGDMGMGSCKTYDIEVWLPAQNTYREISSCSNMGAFQARRMHARMRNAEGKIELLHTLNGSGLAVGRTLIAILENNQQADGSVAIPQVLQTYMNGLQLLKPQS